MENKKTDIALIQQEINTQVGNPTVLNSLMQITFKGLKPESAKQAMLEGMMTGFTFQDFLEKNIYAIPFGQGYSLVSSIDYSRKVGMRSGVVGVSAPIYTENDDGSIKTCEITVKKQVGGVIGDFTALVYFSEYNTNYNQWKQRPRTMIAKVAEMHALRKACPEELSQVYVEEEYEKEISKVEEKEEQKVEDKRGWKQKLEDCKTIDELAAMWEKAPATLKMEPEVIAFKNTLKLKLSPAIEGEVTN